MRTDDYSYYRRRIGVEEEAANHAADPRVRDRHREFAAAYRLRCSLMEAPGPPVEGQITDPSVAPGVKPPASRFVRKTNFDQINLPAKLERLVEICEHA